MQKRTSPSLMWIYVAALVLALGIFIVGVFLAARQQGWAMLAAGCVALIAVLSLWAMSYLAEQISASHRQAHDDALTTLRQRLENINGLLTLMSEQQLISDRAKAVAFREHDRDALRRAIREELSRQDWEAAMVLADDMESTFGYKQEADRFRDEITKVRDEFIRRQINEALAAIDRHCRLEQWNEASAEAQRTMKAMPNVAQAQQLQAEVERRREGHKKQLMESWQEAVGRRDVDGSIEILKKLDNYLTPSEAESMQEAARSIFKAKIENLRAQFAAAVQDHNWTHAMEVGEEIIRDFPNARIAQEVREKMDALRQRAAAPATA